MPENTENTENAFHKQWMKQFALETFLALASASIVFHENPAMIVETTVVMLFFSLRRALLKIAQNAGPELIDGWHVRAGLMTVPSLLGFVILYGVHAFSQKSNANDNPIFFQLGLFLMLDFILNAAAIQVGDKVGFFSANSKDRDRQAQLTLSNV